MTRVSETIEATVSTAANKASMAGSATSIVGWATDSALGMWVGIAVGVIGLAVNWYFKRRSDQRAQEAHQAYLKHLKEGIPAPQEAGE